MFGVGVKLEEGSKNWKLRKFKDLKNSLVKADYRLNSRARFREKLSHIGRDDWNRCFGKYRWCPSPKPHRYLG